MSKCTEIRDFCGDYAFEVEYSEDNKFTMFFNSRRNAETVKRCIEVDDSVPNAATAVDFVEVVRCRDCKYLYCLDAIDRRFYCRHYPQGLRGINIVEDNPYCSYGERREK